MYLVAPLVITLGLSFVLYREKGKWKPTDLWPMDDYKMMDEINLRLRKSGRGSEESLALLKVRGWTEESMALYNVRGYTDDAVKAYREQRAAAASGKTGAPGGGHGPG